jgi:hypothetical protein
MLEVPRRVIEEPQLVAVGDQLVFFARHENDDLDDVGYVAILDSAGKLVREVSAPDAWHVAPIGPSTFGVVMTPDGEITVRVFDTQRLDWRGPATSLDYFVDVSVSVNGTALLHGESESLSSDEPVITRIATLDSAGHVSPWQDIAGDSRLLVNDGSAYLITHADDDWLSVDRIDDELTRRPAATSVSLADGAFVENPVMADDGLYLVGYRALRRFSCQTAK